MTNLPKDYADYMEEERMDTTAEWALMLLRAQETLKTASTPQQRRYIQAQIKHLQKVVQRRLAENK